MGTQCVDGDPCQIWGHVAVGQVFSLTNNYVAGAQVNYLVEGMDVMGSLVESLNTSGPTRASDWESDTGCSMGGALDTWGQIDRAAHHPQLAGWVDQRIHCER
jgi:hypothetical protein